MLDFLYWVLNRRENSKDTARERLHVALMRDRVDVAPEVLESLKRDILAAVSRYMVLGDDFQDIQLVRRDESAILVSNIRVKDVRRRAALT